MISKFKPFRRGCMPKKVPVFAAIILAAGSSTRMGQCKPLLSINKQSLLSHLVTTYINAGVSHIIVVTGAYRELVERECRYLHCKIAYNKNHDTGGMFSSVICGVQTLPSEVSAFFVHPCDIPLVRSSTIHSLLHHWDTSMPVLTPVFKGKKGHPPLLSKHLLPYILSWSGEDGLAGFLRRYTSTSLLSVPDQFILYDIDTPEDYRKALHAWNTHTIPTEEECEELFSIARTPEKVIRHCRVVQKVARHIALSVSSFHPCHFLLVDKAALLHDICRTSPHHANAGYFFLKNWGFDAVAELVKNHMYIPEDATTETKILYLADKIVKDFNIVSLQERIDDVLSKWKGGQASKQGLRRLHKALDIQNEFEKLTDGNLDVGE